MQDNSSTSQTPRIGLSHGDFNGVSYEIILKAFSDARMLTLLTPILYGQSKALSYYKKNFGIEGFNYSLTRDARQSWDQKFNIINIVESELKIEPGENTELSDEMATLSLKLACEDLKNGYIDAMVMSPASRALTKTHVNYLASSFGVTGPMKMLVNGDMRIALLTDEQPLQEAVAAVDANRIFRSLFMLSKSLNADFNIQTPKIAVMGLNPHSGEKGMNHKKDIVFQSIQFAQEKGIYAFGPFSSEQLFVSGLWKRYDAILAMYYDQGVLPFELLSSDEGAYYWVGLPMVCTAPLQGPCFEMANANKAQPTALRKAFYLALDILYNHAEK